MTPISNYLTKKLIVIPMKLPWNWTTDVYERTAIELAKHCYVVCIESPQSIKKYITSKETFYFHQEGQRIWRLSPFSLPFQRLKIFRLINDIFVLVQIVIIVILLQLKFNLKSGIIWVFEHEFFNYVAWFKKYMKYSSIYDCTDYQGNQDYVLHNDQKISNENKLILAVDHFFVNSKTLGKLHNRIRKSCEILPQGFRIDSFKDAKESNVADHTFLRKIQLIKKKHTIILGYVGGLNFRIDYKLLISLLKSNPQYALVCIGPIQDKYDPLFTKYAAPYFDDFISLSNVYFFGKVEKELLPNLIRYFDFGCIPYSTDMPFNYYCFPMKLFEFMYEGKRTISTKLSELKYYQNSVYIGENAVEWNNIIKAKSKSIVTNNERNKFRKICRYHSWKNKINRIIKHIYVDTQ